ncbi:GTA-gp10 family protein [Paracoccus sp. (in: a-proteobacteria)]|uniref:GTA-gp10 family protein n=1 Tax=Paracoccus sp. TaxID=267 RepID=UPI00289A1818|nr:GTA-gp10 family protein [Paracoccus sp. (in: a-proteobacteria)]
MEALIANWPSGEDAFLLRIGELEALDDLTAAGVLDLRYRLSQGVPRGSLGYAPVKVREVLACLRLGLIGAGMDRVHAERKVKQAFENGDIAELNLMAFTIISRAFASKEHDAVGEAEAEAGAAEIKGSASPASTAAAPRSASRPRKSKK